MICPRCHGEKVMHGFGCPGFRPMTFPCPDCGGAGEIPDERAGWIEAGQRMQKARVDRGVSLREEAKRLGVSAVLLSDVEHGRLDPQTLSTK